MKNIHSTSRVAGYWVVWDVGNQPMYFVYLLLINKCQLKLTVKILGMFESAEKQLFCDPNAIFKIYDTENILSELKIYHVASVRHEDPCPEPCSVGMWNMSSCSEMPHKGL